MKKISKKKSHSRLNPSQSDQKPEKVEEKPVRKKILTISDMPVSISGVALQTRFFCEALLDSGKYDVVSIGGGQNMPNKQPFFTEQYGERWKIYPVEGYGDENTLRSLIEHEKPDMLWMMTDPRFYYWLWSMDDEIRQQVPIVYYHVWDNYPVPFYNKQWYDSCDVIVSISKLTKDIVETVSNKKDGYNSFYLPHTVGEEYLKPANESNVNTIAKSIFPNGEKNKKVFFFNSRNAKRKMSASLVFWFKDFLDIVGKDNAVLIMNTNPFDPYGSNLHEIVKLRELEDDKSVLFFQDRLPDAALAAVYNLADWVVCPSDAEGFGISSLEGMATGTPVISTRTGGLQDQNVLENGEVLGFSIVPASQAIIGSQDIPYIYEDRISKEDFLKAMLDAYNMPEEQYSELSEKCAKRVKEHFNRELYNSSWIDIIDSVVDKWNQDKSTFGYRQYTVEEI